MTQEAKWLLEEKYQGKTSADYLIDCERLKAGEPLAYIIGYVPFLDCQIYLDSKPLIPRPETEYWVEKAIDTIKQTFHSNERFVRVLDLCAGSGAIGVAVAKTLTQVSVTFSELEASHLLTIEKNLAQTSSDSTIIYDSGKYRIIESDLFENLTEKFDFILSNPPYIDPLVDRAEPSVKDFEPHLALYGELAGLELIAKIIEEAPRFLNKKGQLWLEHEPEQVETINELASKNFSVENYEDQYGVKRYSTLTLLAPENMAK